MDLCQQSNVSAFQNTVSVQFSLSHDWLFAIPWTAACQAFLSITNSWNLLKLMSIESVMPSKHIFLCRPLLLPSSIFPSIRVFSSELVLHIRWPKYWEFQLQHQSFQWISRTDFLQDGLVGSPCSPRDSQESSLSRFVITFLPRSNHLLISWLQSPSAVIFRAQEEEICHYFHFFPFSCHEVMGPDAMILVFFIFKF